MTTNHTAFNTAPLNPALEEEVKSLVNKMTLSEKISMLSGRGFYEKFLGEDERQFGLRAYHAGSGNERLDIEPLYFCDGPRGVRHKTETTCFPVSMARGAAWDPDLERRIGEAMGVEARAVGASLSGAVCINVLRHPAWGRAQETYGEDPYHIGELGAALTEGIQTHNVIATVKHFAVNSIENSRFTVDVKISDRALYEVYLPHFKRVLMSGCASVMSAYNRMNGAYCGHNTVLLRDILKEEWGFKGFVHSDWIKGVYDYDALSCGLDIEMPEGIHFGGKLEKAVTDGEVEEAHVDEAVTRILRTQLTFSRAEDPRTYSQEDIACHEHISLAREAAEKSFVLLKNEGLLPLDAKRIKKLAVIGKLADEVNLGDKGSSNITPPYAVTFLEGLKAKAGADVDIVYDEGETPESIAACLDGADAAIAITGYTWRDEGEFIPGNEALEGLDPGSSLLTRGGDRASLRLLDKDETMINHIAEHNVPLFVGIVSGSAVEIENWKDKADAIMMLWYPGMEGGTALASVLFGDVSPSGKLPFTMSTSPDHLPFFDASADEIDYDLYHGYTFQDKNGYRPAFPFGFGLSYTSFDYGEIRKRSQNDKIEFEIDITNTGDRDGDEIVQLYIGFDTSPADRPARLLRGFRRLSLAPGETATATFAVTPQDLAYYDDKAGAWTIDDIAYTAQIGANLLDSAARTVVFRLPVSR